MKVLRIIAQICLHAGQISIFVVNMSSTKREKKHLKVAYEGQTSETVDNVKKSKFVPKNNWEIFENIRQMRANETAPVDTMGCEKCSDENADEPTKRYQILVALMLSAQTKDGK